jgi:hypothetical protein
VLAGRRGAGKLTVACLACCRGLAGAGRRSARGSFLPRMLQPAAACPDSACCKGCSTSSPHILTLCRPLRPILPPWPHPPAPPLLPAEAAKDVVLAEKPTISGPADGTDPALLRELLSELGSLSSVYHKPAASFVSKARLAVQRADDLAAGARGSASGDSGAAKRLRALPAPCLHWHWPCTRMQAAQLPADPAPPCSPSAELLTSAAVGESPLAGGNASSGATPTGAAAAAAVPPPAVPDLLGDLLDLDVPAPAPAPAAGAPPAAPAGDLGSGAAAGQAKGPGACCGAVRGAPSLLHSLPPPPTLPPPCAASPDLPVVLAEDKGRGAVLRAALTQQGGSYAYQLAVTNVSAGAPLDSFMIQVRPVGLLAAHWAGWLGTGLAGLGGHRGAALLVCQHALPGSHTSRCCPVAAAQQERAGACARLAARGARLW